MDSDEDSKGDFNIDFEGACAAAVAAAANTSQQETNEDGSALNISDVIDAIKIQDPQTAIEMFPSASGMTQGGGGAHHTSNQNDEPTIMDHTTYNGGVRAQQQTTSAINNNNNNNNNNKSNDNSQSTSPRRNQHPSGDNRNWRNTAYVKIVEQPASKALRFRYECEGRSAGSIPGINSTHENKTYPTIEVVGYQGRAFVVVSCVTKDKPYRPHPHNLVGKDGCKRGVCTIEINSETMRAQFSNLGIQCVKKKDIESALIEREKIKVDPFRTGFAHRFQPSSIDLNAVRLCFQVFLEEKTGKFNIPLTPIVSNPIYDKKAMSDLIICKLCSCSSTVAGGKELILLCEKVAKEDISVRFFEEKNGQIIWEAYGDFQHTDVHKQTAISFRTPRYKDIHVERPVTVNIQLKRPSDGATSEALPFDFLPLDAVDPEFLKRKRQKTNGDPRIHYEKYLERYPPTQQQQQQESINIDQKPLNVDSRNHCFIANPTPIKTEPTDSSPNQYTNFGTYRPPQQTPSPQPQMSPPYQEVPSPYSLPGVVGANGNSISPGHQFNAGNISPYSYGQGSTPEYSPYHQQQHSPFGNLNTNTQPSQIYNGPPASQSQAQQGQSTWNIASQTNNTQHSPNHVQDPFSNITKQNNFHVENLLTNDVNNHQQQQHHQNKWKSNLMNVNIIQTNNNNGGSFVTIMHPNDNTQQSTNHNTTNSQSIQLPDGGDTEPPNVSSLLDMDSEQLLIMNSAELKELQLS